jgi:hypothetical protein
MSRRGGRQQRRQPGQANFLPTSLPGCVLWLRADLGITIGTGVSAWADQSGNGNGVTQATGANQPTVNAAGAPNSLPCLVFNGSTQFLSAASAITSATAFTWFVVNMTTTVTVSECMFHVGGAADGIGLTVDSATNSERGVLVQNVANESDAVNSATTSWEKWTSTGSAAPLQTLRVNGASRTIAPSNSTPVAPTATTFIGCFVSGTQMWNGSIAEVIAYNSVLSVGAMGQVEAYLHSRYGL